jgi:crossover junction endodeoxyribonuclease RusA
MIEADPDPFGRAVSEAECRATAEPVVPAVPGKPITLTLPYPPSANRYWRSRVITPKGKDPIVSTYVSSEAKQFKEAVGWLLRGAGVRRPMAGRVAVHLELWPHRPLDWAKRAKADPLYWADTVQRLDLDNCRKVVNDALKDVAFGDDKCIWKDSGEVMEPDGREACLVVTITPLLKVSPQETLL